MPTEISAKKPLLIPAALVAVGVALAGCGSDQGFKGMAEAAGLGTPIVARQILTSMRHGEPTLDVAQLAVDFRDNTVVGFDIAGAEDGWSPIRFEKVFEFLRRKNMQYTIHAGEAFGPASIWEAVQLCGASRIGHGVRLVEDITGGPGEWVLGDLANYVLDRRIALEICPSSNLQTGIADTVAEHPFGLLAELGFRVTVSCDNRLMSRTTLSREFGLLADAFGYDLTDLRRFTLNAARSAFHPYRQREALIRDVILPGFAALGLPADAPW